MIDARQLTGVRIALYMKIKKGFTWSGLEEDQTLPGAP